MIDFLKGKLAHKDPTFVIIEVNGVGYRVNISLNTYSALGGDELIKLHTYFHVREDIQALYGFFDNAEKEVFKALISISGIGPSSAMVVLSSLTPNELQNAVIHNDVNTIQSVKGIGNKTAQRIIIELKDKLLKINASAHENISSKSHNTTRNDALSALSTLGVSKSVAEKAIDKALKENKDASVEELIKIALKSS